MTLQALAFSSKKQQLIRMAAQCQEQQSLASLYQLVLSIMSSVKS
jgi:hypothetical protein